MICTGLCFSDVKSSSDSESGVKVHAEEEWSGEEEEEEEEEGPEEVTTQ